MIRRSQNGIVSTEIKWNGKEAEVMGEKIISGSIIDVGIHLQGQMVLLCPVDQRRLSKSIIFKTKEDTIYNNSGAPEKGDDLSVPTESNVGHVGTNCEYAQFVEYGSGPHETDAGSADFVANMERWCQLHGIKDAGAVIQSIRKHGTKAQSFIRPAFDLAQGETLKLIEERGKVEFEKYKQEVEK